jgi:hypothetical protein
MIKEQRTMRIAQVSFIVYAAALFWIMHFLKPQQPAGELTDFHKIIAGVAAADCLIGIWIRRILLNAPAGKLRDGTIANAAKRWFVANIIGYAFAMSTCLFGLVLHVLGAPDRLAQALVGLGILVMIGYLFGRPPAAEPGISPYESVE